MQPSFIVRTSEPLFIPQIAAWVRFWTLILRRIALTWTFTVASAISILRAMHLLESPAIRHCMIDFSRGDSCCVMLRSAVMVITGSLSLRGSALAKCSLS